MASNTQFKVKPAEALERLKAANKAYLEGKPPTQSHDDAQRRGELKDGQEPFAVIVSCSDSRVPPERVFGCGLGDLFVIRVAGNTIDTAALGSIQYAVGNLHSPLVVVMGHEQCGAVKAAITVVNKDATFPGAIGRMVEPIIPAVLEVRNNKKAGSTWDETADTDAAVRANVRRVVEGLRTAPDAVVTCHLEAGRVAIVGAHYDLKTGAVEFFDGAAGGPLVA